MAKVTFWKGARAKYDALTDKLNTRIYFCEDTGELFKGTVQFTGKMLKNLSIDDLATYADTDIATAKAVITFMEARYAQLSSFNTLQTSFNTLKTAFDARAVKVGETSVTFDATSNVADITTAVNTLIANANHMTVEVVEALPAVADASSTVIYLVPAANADEQDVYDQYLFIPGEDGAAGTFEKIGNTKADLNLSQYATNSYVNTELAKKITMPTAPENSAGYVLSIAADGTLSWVATGQTEVNAQIGGLTTRVETLEGEMDDVEGRLDVVEPIVAKLNGDASTAGSVAEAKAAADAAQADADAVAARITTAEGQLTTLTGTADVAGSVAEAKKAGDDAATAAGNAQNAADNAQADATAALEALEWIDGDAEQA